MVFWRKLILFGDSLTQYSFQPNGWGAAIADLLQRKADVLNRGFSGYNTDNAVDMLHLEFPRGTLEERDAVVLFFGANDSTLPDFDQHVPLERYQSNMLELARHFLALGIPKDQILLLSPSPTDEKAHLAHMIAQSKGKECDRDNGATKRYADACRKAASEVSCPFVDVWSSFMAQENWGSLLCDGLHFSEAGNQLLAKLVMEKVEGMTVDWKMNYPDWKEFYSTRGATG